LNFESRLNGKISEAIEYDSIKFQVNSGLTAEECGMVLTYRKNRVNLAMAFLMIMETCHEQEIIHNDLSLSNVLLHFPPMDKSKVYIGVCDWGRCSNAKENQGSWYGRPTTRELAEMKAKYKHVAPELFYVYGPQNSDTSLEKMQKLHTHSKAVDCFAAGRIAQWIWHEEYDKDHFRHDASRIAYFEAQLQSLQHDDPSKRRTIAEVLGNLTGAPCFFKLPNMSFRDTI
jgi:serine/threonine protein kinase